LNLNVIIKNIFIISALLPSMVLADINAPKYTFRGGEVSNSKNVYHGSAVQQTQQTSQPNRTSQQTQYGTAKNPYYVPNVNQDFWSYPRKLRLKRAATGEYVEAIYWANGQINMDGYNKLNWLMRDVRAGAVTNIDVRLFDLLYAIQSWVSYYGYTSPLIITSGFRSEKTNRSTEGAAKNSMHVQGKATDFYIPNLPWQYVGQLAATYQAGGVGFYPGQRFIHVDTGRVRYWVHGPGGKKIK